MEMGWLSRLQCTKLCQVDRAKFEVVSLWCVYWDFIWRKHIETTISIDVCICAQQRNSIGNMVEWARYRLFQFQNEPFSTSNMVIHLRGWAFGRCVAYWNLKSVHLKMGRKKIIIIIYIKCSECGAAQCTARHHFRLMLQLFAQLRVSSLFVANEQNAIKPYDVRSDGSVVQNWMHKCVLVRPCAGRTGFGGASA